MYLLYIYIYKSHIENVFLTKNGVNDLSKLTNLENL